MTEAALAAPKFVTDYMHLYPMERPLPGVLVEMLKPLPGKVFDATNLGKRWHKSV